MNKETAERKAAELGAKCPSLRYKAEFDLCVYARENKRLYDLHVYDEHDEFVGSFNSIAVMLEEEKRGGGKVIAGRATR